ncbi:MAG: M28 family peptidase [Balneolaceae bacterium]|nr:M28 family peptidase [Balneolaceae bacterium]
MQRNLRSLILLAASLILACSSSKQSIELPVPDVTDFQNTITEEGLLLDLSVIASDEMEGRDTGSEGLKKAADYLAQRYQELGLEPVGDNGTYFQHFNLTGKVFESITYSVHNADGELVDESTHSANEIGNFNTLLGGDGAFSGDLFFAGYGISDESIGINHFEGNVDGKWLVIFYDRTISNFMAMQDAIDQGGALGAILIIGTDEQSFDDQATRLQGEFGESAGLSLEYLSDAEAAAPFNRIRPTLATQLFGLDTLEELAELEAEIKDSPDAFEGYELQFSLSHSAEVENEVVETKNIVAFLEGTDPVLKNEVVVLSSHYDHVGISTPDSTGDAIYNGADDDGSGTVGLLHAAQALASAKQSGAEIKRSVLILHVSGEEKGLLGSRYYSDHPIFSIENTVANLNSDMIGRRDNQFADNPNYIYVIGGKIISSGLQATLEQANAMSVNLELSDRYNDLNDPNQFYRRSDHWNFGRLGVPFIFFFNGTHADYHRPSDEIEKIDFEALQKRTKLIFMTTALLANDDDRPVVDNQQFIEKTRESEE